MPVWNHSKSLLLTAWWIQSGPGWGWAADRSGAAVFSIRAGNAGIILYCVFAGIGGVIRHGANAAQYSTGYCFCKRKRGISAFDILGLFFSAVFLLVGACLWPVLILAAGCIGFLGLFVRVIKNMLTEAIGIKEENDFTI